MKKSKFGAVLAAIAILIALGIGVLEATNIIDTAKYSNFITGGLIIFGIILGLVNISKKESMPFMVAALVIGGASTLLALVPFASTWIQIIFAKVALLIIPAAIMVAIAVAYDALMH